MAGILPGRDQGRMYLATVAVDDQSLVLLRQMAADGRIGADHMFVRDGRAKLALTPSDIERLGQLGFEVEVGRDLEATARAAQAEIAPPAIAREEAEAGGLRTGFVDRYLDAAAIMTRFDRLHADFPVLTRWTELPNRTHGYDGSAVPLRGPATVRLFEIGSALGDRSRPGLLMVAGTHAREWIPPIAAIELAETLLRNHDPASGDQAVRRVTRLVEGLRILIVPACNPDGINFSHHDEAMWRKNRRRPAASSCGGVDNNRNFSMSWGEAGSSGDPCNESFRGPSALSEPENRNVVHVLEQFPEILAAVDCHSFGEDLFRPHPTPGPFGGPQPVAARDHAIYLSLEAAMNAAIGSVSPGKTYSTGTTNNHAGTLDDYFFLAHRVFGFTLECGQEFQPPIAEGLGVVREVVAAMLALADQTLALPPRLQPGVATVVIVDASAAAGSTPEGAADMRRRARGLIDLLSPGDALAVIACGDASTVQFPLTTIAGAEPQLESRGRLDAMTFGGGAALGLALRRAAGVLAGVAGPKAVVLFTDAQQDPVPHALDELAGLPAGTRVFAATRTPAANESLLQQIATRTGGRLFSRPTGGDLIRIYNALHGT